MVPPMQTWLCALAIGFPALCSLGGCAGSQGAAPAAPAAPLTAAVLSAEAPRETGFLDRTLVSEGETYRYQVYVPSGWTPAHAWPVILFLHGAGERGQDGLIQTEVGVGSAIRRFPDRYPAVVVMPQCRTGAWWNHMPMQTMALAALDRAVKEWNGDARRLYLTGLSMGGYGTWAIAARLPGKFAALAPICGGVSKRDLPAGTTVPFPGDGTPDPFKVVAQAVGKTPVWVFHGAKDPTVMVSESRNMVEALKAAAGDVKYTEYPEAGHDSWTAAYRERDFPAWLLAQQLRP
jgi:predicted peptidase